LLNREAIEGLVKELGARCAAKSLDVEMFLVGGAAMVLAYSRERLTRDIDAIFEPKMAVYEEARRMADEHGLPPDWLNDAVKGLMPDNADDGEKVYFASEGISVAVASPAYLFAMKALSARLEDDSDDFLVLAGILGVTDAEHAFAVVERYYRAERLTAKASFFVQSLLGPAGRAPDRQAPGPRPDQVYVSGHLRDGRPVAGHWRRMPGPRRGSKRKGT
jgi:hypothetical protein